MSTAWWKDDEQLLATLDDALTSARAVPPAFLEAAKATYAWRTVDTELAALTYDSAEDFDLAGAVRAEPVPLRALTFASPEFTVELDLTPEMLIGQLSPGQPGRVTAYTGTAEAGAGDPDGTQIGTAAIDDLGFFTLRPTPDQPFRLLCRTSAGATVLTGWVSP